MPLFGQNILLIGKNAHSATTETWH